GDEWEIWHISTIKNKNPIHSCTSCAHRFYIYIYKAGAKGIVGCRAEVAKRIVGCRVEVAKFPVPLS
ncbi:MAG: hypothetical protein MJA29_01895, partial [Candidatus Omnitrophica bacterium]|nr:hypothetical protein [Candidatus Omnitrophota bacterium]